DPERRRRREPAHRQSLADDRAGAEEADAGHDLGCDPGRIGANDVAAGDEEVVEAVRGDECEEARAERHQEMRAHPRLAVAKLAPQIAAQRVPPSAWRTSQSSHTVRSPRASKLTTARSARPIRRWISTVRPPCFPRAASRSERSPVDAGSSEYSAVIHPRPD